MDGKDLFGVLGVARTASEDEIKQTYRKLARRYHPDVNPNNPSAEERFKEISFAYDVLSDPDKRKLYEEFGEAGLTDGFDPNQARGYRSWSRGARRSPHNQTFTDAGDLGDLFAEFFGPRDPFRAAGPVRGADASGEVTVDFLDAVLGAEVPLQVRRAAPGGGERQLMVKIPVP